MDLLRAAAIGATGGLVLAAAQMGLALWIFSTPVIPAILSGLWIVPGVAALTITRRGGTGLLAGALAAVICSVPSFSLTGLFLSVIAYGAAAELPFFITRYRTWGMGIFLLSGLAGGIALAATNFHLVALAADGSFIIQVLGITIILVSSLLCAASVIGGVWFRVTGTTSAGNRV
ncbi:MULTISPECIES: ECF transporter S component [unclassified Pseudonocardia]